MFIGIELKSPLAMANLKSQTENGSNCSALGAQAASPAGFGRGPSLQAQQARPPALPGLSSYKWKMIFLPDFAIY